MEEAAEHVRTLVVDAIKRQLVGDVPICTFLSGGLDSSAISAIAAEEFRNRGKVLELAYPKFQNKQVQNT